MTRHLTVLDPGPLSTVQDRGRPGWAHLGVPRSGVADGPAAALANRLVGNPEDAAVVETTLGGVVLQVSTAMTLAVTGADAGVHVDRRPVARVEPLTLHAGQVLRVGPARTGLRSYVAVAGGITVPPVLGSRATDTLSGIGPPALATGQRLPVGPPVGPPQPVDVSVVPTATNPLTLRFRPGPRQDWFAASALATVSGSTYTVSPDSNRVGVRFTGPVLQRPAGQRPQELPSEGIVLGAIQVPPAGLPLVFLTDHPTTGGYPVLGVVLAADLPACGQLRPGDQVRFAGC